MIAQNRKVYIFVGFLTVGMYATQVIAGKNDFSKKLYEPVQLISEIVLPPEPHPNLSEEDKRAVLDARNTLVLFLKSFRNERENPLSYLAPPLRKHLPDNEQLYRAVGGGPESHLLKFQVVDFAYRKSAKEVILYTEFTITGYGEDRTTPKAFAMVQDAGKWKLSRFGNDVREREFEEQRK